MRYPLFLLTVLFSLTVLNGCATVWDKVPGVYVLEIQQGNVVDQAMINQLKPQMTKRQVLYLLGSPMLTDPFHQNRWDYIYAKQLDGGVREQKRIALYFSGDILTGIQGDFKPDLQAARPVKESTVDVPPRDLEKTLWEKIVWLFGGTPPAKPPTPATETEQPNYNHPLPTE